MDHDVLHFARSDLGHVTCAKFVISVHFQAQTVGVNMVTCVLPSGCRRNPAPQKKSQG